MNIYSLFKDPASAFPHPSSHVSKQGDALVWSQCSCLGFLEEEEGLGKNPTPALGEWKREASSSLNHA